MVRVYKVSYEDDEAFGKTSIYSCSEVTKLQAKELITEQLQENNIHAGEVEITSFDEVKNPILKLFYQVKSWITE